MNAETIEANARNLTGLVKDGIGGATGDTSLQAEGKADQVGAQFEKGYGSAREAVLNGTGPLVDKAKAFAKDRPWATAALAGVLGVALLNTLRGKR